MISDSARRSSLSMTGLFHLFVVYILWSTTYLAIRVAVMPGSGFPPFAMAASRMFTVSLVLLLYARFLGQSLRLSKQEFIMAAVTGLFMWLGGNGLVTWAEQSADSGFAALMIASTPIWAALYNTIGSRKMPSFLFIGALVFGFCGVGVLMLPTLRAGNIAGLAATIALLVSTMSWAFGSYYQSRSQINLPIPVLCGYQHLFGGLGMLVLWAVLDEPIPHPSINAWIAWGYLVVFGSLIAFTSYIKALKLLPISIAMTYSYVNPVLALLLGWLLLKETITVWTIAGALMVLLGVLGVFRALALESRGVQENAEASPSLSEDKQ